MAIKRVLCVCKGNTCRSPMLAELIRRAVESRGYANFAIASAGIISEAAGQPAAPEWTELMSETGIDLSAHRSRFIGEIGSLGLYDYIICAEPSVVDEIRRLGVREERILLANSPEGMPNPWKHPDGVEAYRRCYHITVEIANSLVRTLTTGAQ